MKKIMFLAFLLIATQGLAARDKIYLQPIGEFPTEQSPSFEMLQNYVQDFFGFEVIVLPSISLSELHVSRRYHPMTGKYQIASREVLNYLGPRVPQDAFALVGMTLEDLFPESSEDFSFGMADARRHVAICSFARYDPLFFRRERSENYEELLYQRACKVLSHEIVHLYGLRHCKEGPCLMNASHNLEESDARPMTLCSFCRDKQEKSKKYDS